MNANQKRYIKNYMNYCRRIAGLSILFLLSAPLLILGGDFHWQEIHLKDSAGYQPFFVDTISDAHYPPVNLFDGDTKTCWVAGAGKSETLSKLWIRLPQDRRPVINIFSGYGKSAELHRRNAAPKLITYQILAAINPDGFVSETTALYRAAAYPVSGRISLQDTFAIQSFSLDLVDEPLIRFKQQAFRAYKEQFKAAIADTGLILQLAFDEIRPGSKYDDVCISELFFNDRLICEHQNGSDIQTVYLNKDENALLIDNESQKGLQVYSDPEAVLQIIETSPDNRWVIVIAMPVAVDGRAETRYLLFNLLDRRLMNPIIERIHSDYPAGSELYFSQEGNKTYLNYADQEFNSRKIELR